MIKVNKPKIRFNEFENTWIKSKLGELYEVYSGNTPSRSDSRNYQNGEIPWIKTTDLNNSIIYANEEKISVYGATKLKVLPEKSVLIAMYGGFNQIGRTGLLAYPATINQALAALMPINEIYPNFLLNFLNFKKESWRNVAASSRKDPNITKNDVEKFIISFPSLEEQSAIGSLFHTLDDLLASYKDNLANYQSLKSTMLSKMFPKAGKTVPEIRLDGFEGEWENLRLGDCAIIKGRLGWKSLKQEEYTEVGPSMIAGKHIKNGVIDWGEVDHIPQWRYDESPEIMLEKGDIIFSKDGSLGNPALVSNLKGEATINSTMMLVRLDKKVSSQFFYQVLTSSVFQKLIYLKVSGSSIPHLFQADMQDFRFFAPCIEEQQAIGAYFSNLDNLIVAHQDKISQLETLKKKLLQDMFI